MFKEKIIIEMKEVFKEIPFGIEHTLKVLKRQKKSKNMENMFRRRNMPRKLQKKS